MVTTRRPGLFTPVVQVPPLPSGSDLIFFCSGKPWRQLLLQGPTLQGCDGRDQSGQQEEVHIRELPYPQNHEGSIDRRQVCRSWISRKCDPLQETHQSIPHPPSNIPLGKWSPDGQVQGIGNLYYWRDREEDEAEEVAKKLSYVANLEEQFGHLTTGNWWPNRGTLLKMVGLQLCLWDNFV